MNIFKLYLDKIIDTIDGLNQDHMIKLSEEGDVQDKLPKILKRINVDAVPKDLDFDISTNVAMILAKINKKSPIDFAEFLIPYLKDNDMEAISVAKPGFINIKFKPSFWSNFIKEIIDNEKEFGINKNEKKYNYLVEFVSANPTGPLHVGHSRGAILGDVLSNVLIFNKHKVTKEYYVNDYGNQIINFTKSVYFRIREIVFKESFPTDNEDLYPGDYLIEFAQNIINSNNKIDFKNFDNISDKLRINISKIGIITNKGYEYSQNGKVTKVKSEGYDHFVDS